MEISRTGKGTETKYSLMALPKSRFESDDKWNEAIEQAKEINLEALFE